ncbi:hypothetical protein chiPu_0027427, partial [Chiloscyllium punctatum]|nr:hypothetical protein [Chiloscyllium punctatum]
MGGSAAEDLDWGPEGSLTRFIANENKKVIKAMLHSGWRPADPLDVQRECWARQKKDRYVKACVLVLQAHVRLAGKVQLYVQDKKKQTTEHLEAQALAAHTVLPTLSDAPSAPPSPTWDWEGLTDNLDTQELRTGYARAAPVKVEYTPGGGEGGRATTLAHNPRLKMTYVSLTPGDTMKLLDRLPTLKPRHNNAEFWQRLREMQICHNLH